MGGSVVTGVGQASRRRGAWAASGWLHAGHGSWLAARLERLGFTAAQLSLLLVHRSKAWG